MIISVDIGATNSRWGTGTFSSERFNLDRHEERPTAGLTNLAEPLKAFAAREKIDAVAIGIAGPIEGTHASTTNAGLSIDTHALGDALGGAPVYLLNDLEAQAYGISVIADESLVTVKPGTRGRGARALIAAGTGLGESIVAFNRGEAIVLPTESGHCDFSPSTKREEALLDFLRGRYTHVSWERVLSGSFGFRNLLDFVGQGSRDPLIASLSGLTDIGHAVQTAAEAGDPLACDVIHLFLRLYGVEAGNLALRSLARGGVYIGGGIAARLLPFFAKSEFAAAFSEKGRISPVLEDIPVYVVTDGYLGLRGAGEYARLRSLRK